ncbi:MAG: hypothetical protein MK132_15375 [Lentisphaerales bacterium]|nr:hypothetical protein [Lentisphaerales bacterium]
MFIEELLKYNQKVMEKDTFPETMEVNFKRILTAYLKNELTMNKDKADFIEEIYFSKFLINSIPEGHYY